MSSTALLLYRNQQVAKRETKSFKGFKKFVIPVLILFSLFGLVSYFWAVSNIAYFEQSISGLSQQIMQFEEENQLLEAQLVSQDEFLQSDLKLASEGFVKNAKISYIEKSSGTLVQR